MNKEFFQGLNITPQDTKEESTQKERLFQLVHDHRFGVDTHYFYSNKNCVAEINERSLPDEDDKKIIRALSICFEPERDETIIIYTVDTIKAKTINF